MRIETCCPARDCDMRVESGERARRRVDLQLTRGRHRGAGPGVAGCCARPGRHRAESSALRPPQPGTAPPGEPSPPAPTSSTRASCSSRWPAGPTSGSDSCRAYRSTSRLPSTSSVRLDRQTFASPALESAADRPHIHIAHARPAAGSHARALTTRTDQQQSLAAVRRNLGQATLEVAARHMNGTRGHAGQQLSGVAHVEQERTFARLVMSVGRRRSPPNGRDVWSISSARQRPEGYAPPLRAAPLSPVSCRPRTLRRSTNIFTNGRSRPSGVRMRCVSSGCRSVNCRRTSLTVPAAALSSFGAAGEGTQRGRYPDADVAHGGIVGRARGIARRPLTHRRTTATTGSARRARLVSTTRSKRSVSSSAARRRLTRGRLARRIVHHIDDRHDASTGSGLEQAVVACEQAGKVQGRDALVLAQAGDAARCARRDAQCACSKARRSPSAERMGTTVVQQAGNAGSSPAGALTSRMRAPSAFT